ncbi:MAG TPA: sigma 54-interacting transcriptional regulator [Acidobacteriota bacterium]
MSKQDTLSPDQELRTRLEEAEQALEAIRKGDVDSLVVSGKRGEQVVPLNILDLLGIGIVLTGLSGEVTFLNQPAERLLDANEDEALGLHWERILPIRQEDRPKLRSMIQQRARRRLSLPTDPHRRSRGWIDVEVHDDPRDNSRKIFFIYESTELHDLRSLVQERVKAGNFIGESQPMNLLFDQIRQLAKVDATVLIEGETGTGKELVARSIHFSSRRKENPFIAFNCPAVTESLVASQLFGHRRGAFTGATEDRKGFCEAANGGTLFLDEICDLPLQIQTYLLRVLEEKEITRVGDAVPRKVDIRVIAATNRNLKEAVEKKEFRADLYYRLKVARIYIPPLRGRKEDIPLLVKHFLAQCRLTIGKPVEEISSSVLNSFLHYPWPGNVRELKNTIESAVIHCQGSTVGYRDLPPEFVEFILPGAEIQSVSRDPRERILAAMEVTQGNRTAAARLLGIGRATLYRYLAKMEKIQ